MNVFKQSYLRRWTFLDLREPLREALREVLRTPLTLREDLRETFLETRRRRATIIKTQKQQKHKSKQEIKNLIY